MVVPIVIVKNGTLTVKLADLSAKEGDKEDGYEQKPDDCKVPRS